MVERSGTSLPAGKEVRLKLSLSSNVSLGSEPSRPRLHILFPPRSRLNPPLFLPTPFAKEGARAWAPPPPAALHPMMLTGTRGRGASRPCASPALPTANEGGSPEGHLGGGVEREELRRSGPSPRASDPIHLSLRGQDASTPRGPDDPPRPLLGDTQGRVRASSPRGLSLWPRRELRPCFPPALRGSNPRPCEARRHRVSERRPGKVPRPEQRDGRRPAPAGR